MKRLYGWLCIVVGFLVGPEPVVPAQSSSSFAVQTRILGKGFSARQQGLMRQAARRVERLITRRAPSVRVDSPAGYCDKGLPAIHETVKDFFVFVQAVDLGEDSYANSAPCELRSGSYLPIYGSVFVNSRGLSDLADEDVVDTMAHELIHTLGVGTLWEADERVSMSDESDGRNLVRPVKGKWLYTAPRALAEYKKLGGKGAGIPLDPDRGHWLASLFCAEVLSGTGGPEPGAINPISRVTIAALQDLGWGVNYAAADPYKLPNGGCER